MRSAVQYATLSFLASLLILALKLGSWWTTGSAVLLADAAESALDVVTASLLVLAVRFASTPPDDRHPWGHGKVEYFSSGFQGALILATGGGLLVQSARRVLDGGSPASLGDGLLLSGIATGLNILLAWQLIQAGRRLGSPALEADGRHNLADVITTIGGWTGLGLAWLTGFWLLDPLVAIGVSVQILVTGVQLLRSAVDGLMDAALDPERIACLQAALDAALADEPDARVTDLRARESSARVFVDCTLEVPGDLSVARAHRLCDALEAAGAESIPGAEVHVHVEPTTSG